MSKPSEWEIKGVIGLEKYKTTVQTLNPQS